MNEYIERERLLRRFNIDDMMNVNGTLIPLEDARNTISNFPAADVAPVRHGRWERDELGSYLRRCSVCKKTPIYKDERGNSAAVYAGICINCGARMDDDWNV